MSVHAYGVEETSNVWIEGLVSHPLALTIGEAQKLQRQLGVAIGEAAGQQKIELGGMSRAEEHSHGARQYDGS